jgi:hypothetical protein
MLTRRASLLLVGLLPLALAACADSAPPRSYPPLRYSYLPPLRLNVASVDIEQRYVASGEAPDVSQSDPVRPVDALRAMGEDRLKAFGGAGRANLVINNASLTQSGDAITGAFAVQLEVFGADGAKAGFAEAQVTRTRSGETDDLPAVLYDLTKEMMDAMNVELEYQVRHSLAAWLVPENAAPAPVEQQPLAAPPAT